MKRRVTCMGSMPIITTMINNALWSISIIIIRIWIKFHCFPLTKIYTLMAIYFHPSMTITPKILSNAITVMIVPWVSIALSNLWWITSTSFRVLTILWEYKSKILKKVLNLIVMMTNRANYFNNDIILYGISEMIVFIVLWIDISHIEARLNH